VNPPPFGATTAAPGLVARVTNILTKPKQEWPVIAGETTTVASLYAGYIAILAAIPAIAGLISMSFLGTIFRVPIATGVMAAIVSYVLGLAGVYIAAFVIDKLASTFQSQPNFLQALKLVAYAYTAAWVAGIFNIVPVIGFLVVLVGSLYSIYLFYLGLPVMMKTPQDKVIAYMIVSAVIIIIISLVIGGIVGMITASAIIGGRFTG
jgi:hypothetical protein